METRELGYMLTSADVACRSQRLHARRTSQESLACHASLTRLSHDPRGVRLTLPHPLRLSGLGHAFAGSGAASYRLRLLLTLLSTLGLTLLASALLDAGSSPCEGDC